MQHVTELIALINTIIEFALTIMELGSRSRIESGTSQPAEGSQRADDESEHQEQSA